MRILAIDYGDAHTGAAVSDLTGLLAGYTEVIHTRKEAEILRRLGELIREYGVEELVLGYPKNMDGTLGPRAEKAEQNLAFFCIDQTFESLPHKPEKKSLKQDAHGKYLEIAFISPMVGNRYAAELQTLSNQTGWRICIADRVNQNGLLKNAQLLCMKYGISLAKSPSYLPERRTVQMKLREEAPAERLEEVSAAFTELTGCGCTFVS